MKNVPEHPDRAPLRRAAGAPVGKRGSPGISPPPRKASVWKPDLEEDGGRLLSPYVHFIDGESEAKAVR